MTTVRTSAVSPEQTTQRPRRGGVLSLVGAGDVDHLDPALAYHTVTRGIMRACTRQLVTYRATSDHDRAGDLVADLAVHASRPFDAEGRQYRFTLKAGVRWDVGPHGREITAADVVRGIKRLAHPMAPSPGLPYYLSTIEGMVEFRDALVGVERRPDTIAEFLESTDVRGLRIEDERTVVFTIVQPSSDFLNILALPFATPAPVEYLDQVPGSPGIEQRLISNGPYRIAEYRPNARIRLERNTAWAPETDEARAAYVDAIDVSEGLTEDEAYQQVMAGTADLLWDTQPPTERLPELFGTEDPRLEIYLAGLLSPYLVINFLSPNAGGATGNDKVRRALQYAVDKQAVARIWGGPRLNTIAHQILPPLSAARRELRPYPTEGDTGDPERARQLLADAGYPDGLRLKLVFRNQDIHPDTAEAVRAALARAGIEVELVPAPIEQFFAGYLSSTDAARAGAWDIALTGWEPDWNGNNARVYLQALFDSSSVSDNDDWGTNFGHYSSSETNALLEAALSSPDPDQANRLFARAEEQIMRDSAVVPILFAHQYWLHSSRVRNWLPYPVLNGDLTNLWLAET
ncbi:MAG TPA: ABC transporter substrate-binding protein [Jatrophihabitans sp.]|nr:ABC transporter substrate-binding protein [Jatrophihabitans sp.]